MDRIIAFFRNWTLPIAIFIGIAGYFIYVNIPALDCTHQFVNEALAIVQPMLIFLMLFVSFCKISPRELRPRPWMLKMLLIQVGLFVLLGALIIFFPEIPGRVVMESAMVCLICPTATAASVVTAKLNGSASVVVSYTVIINLVASAVVPAIVSLIHDGSADLGFLASFSMIIGKVFPLLIMPLAFAWLVRYLFPSFHGFILKQKDLAFNLWAVALVFAIAVTVKAIVHSDESVWELAGIACASLVACVLQFYLGHRIGNVHGEPVAATQSLGQKNTVFAIWLGYTFLNPVTAMAGGFYSIWHNVINSYQLYMARKNE